MTRYRSFRWVHTVSFFAIGCTSIYVIGCTGEDTTESKQATTSAGAAGASPAFGTGGKTTSLGRGGATSSGGSASKGGSTGVAGAATVTPAAGFPTCTPTSDVDAPDSAGLDTNCDGIDGTVASSVFVSPYGLDSSAGTKDDPVKTIGKAVRLAQASSGKLTDVLLCTATYAENVVVADTAVGLHGGYDCNSWKRTAANAQIAPSSGVALKIVGVIGMELSKLDIKSADATGASESSQAAQVVKSTGVHFDASNIAAGRGAPGANAPLQPKTWNGTKPAKAAAGEAVEVGTDNSLGCHTSNVGVDLDFDGYKDGGPDTTLNRCKLPKAGGDGVATTCSNATGLTIKGGKGGSASLKPLNATPIASSFGTSGQPANGVTIDNTGAAGTRFGSISESGYVATNKGADGIDGAPGFSGLGGMGGGSCLVRTSNIDTTDTLVAGTTETRAGFTCVPSLAWGTSPWNDISNMGTGRTVTMFPGSGGGQGGYGGCGGFAGFGGGAGGASIGLFILESDVSLSKCNVTSGAGGTGGAASDGTDGQAGGEGGDGGLVLRSGVALPTVNNQLLFTEAQLKGANGTSGGQGQNGGAGGPGGGGPSIGILWSGTTAPVYDSTVIPKSGPGGRGGSSALHGTSPGQDGLSGDVVDAATL